jgi:inosine triphosphate pyrophosphatase
MIITREGRIPIPCTMIPIKLVFATGNANKFSEVRDVLGDAFELEAVDLDIPELQGTIEDVAKDKCRRAADIVSL